MTHFCNRWRSFIFGSANRTHLYCYYCNLTADSSSFDLKKKLSDSVKFWRFYSKLKMENQTKHFRHILLFYFRKGKNAREACEKLREVYGSNAPQERQCQRWFMKFRAGDFDLNDAPRSGRPIEIDDNKIKALIESNPRYTTREIAEMLNIHHSSVHGHLKKLGYVIIDDLPEQKQNASKASPASRSRPRTSKGSQKSTKKNTRATKGIVKQEKDEISIVMLKAKDEQDPMNKIN